MALTVDALELRYGAAEVLRALSLRLEPGHIYGLVGMNGSGKTSLLNCIAGLQRYQHGNILYNQQPLHPHQLGYLESKFMAYPSMTGRDYLELFAAGHPDFNIVQWTDLFRLPPDEYIGNYSSGMQQKLGIIGLMALHRELLLMDEPFNALDLEAVEIFKRLLPALAASGKTILLTSHLLETLTDTCDRIFYLTEGMIKKEYQKNQFAELKSDITAYTTARHETQLKALFR